jgi:bifunctional enzyme CysN/CysC
MTQTRRHHYLVSLIGIRQVILAVNKMDLMDYSETVYRNIEAEYRAFAAGVGLQEITAIPLSALRGDNMVESSARMPWYNGPTLMHLLETIELDETRLQVQALRFPVQWVNRPNLDFRGFCGTISSGMIRTGERIRVQPSGRESRVVRIITVSGDQPMAVAGQSITVTLADEIDISRGDVISSAVEPAEVADQFQATIVWMDDEPMLPGRSYLLKLGARTVNATITEPKYKVNVNTMEHLAAKRLDLNEIGVCNLALDRVVPFDVYTDNRETGGFILIDRMSNNTVAAGMLHFALRRSQNIHLQHLDVTKEARAQRLGQRPLVLWFTGLSGAGKSTIANLVEKKLHALGRHCYLLDGDNLRHGLNKDLGFTEADRVENIRRVAEVSRLMVDAGLIVLTAFISPFRAERAMARSLVGEGEFIEVFVDTPLNVAETRDVKGLYAKARRGELSNFTGIDSPYEAPENPELVINTVNSTADAAADQVVAMLLNRA